MDDTSFGGWQIDQKLFDTIRSLVPEGKVILELGSGWASGELAKHYDLYSVEHNQGWVGKYATKYIYAPYNKYSWYDVDKIKQEGPKEYDLLLVDGPDASVRWKFADYLGHLYTACPIIIDDCQEDNILRMAQEVGKKLERHVHLERGETKTFAVIKC